MEKLRIEELELGLKMPTMLFLALMFGQLSLAAVSIFLRMQGEMQSHKELLTPLALAVFITASLGYILGNMLYKKKMQEAQTARAKLNTYQVALLLRLALLEAPCILAFIGYLLVGHSMFLFVGFSLILLFLTHKPTLKGLKEDIGFEEETKNKA